MEGQRHQLRQRSGNRRGTPRRGRRTSTQRTRGIHLEPFINTISMKTVMTIWNASHQIFRKILRQTDRTWAVIGLRQSQTLSQNNLRIRLHDGSIEAQNQNGRLNRARSTYGIIVSDAGTATSISFNTNTYVRSKHNARDQDENTHGDGDSVAEANAGGRRLR